jgi:hypothetical protein
MTQDEKMIWAAVFAETQRWLIKLSGNTSTRGDLILRAAEEADYTVWAIQRQAAYPSGFKGVKGFKRDLNITEEIDET